MNSLYEKLSSTAILSDFEIKRGIEDYTNAEKSLFKLGIVFHVPRMECLRTLHKLQDIAQARGL